MTTTNKLGSVIGLAAVLTLGGCTNMHTPTGTSSSGTVYPQSTNSSSAYTQYGVVQSIDLVRVDNTGIGVGAIAGAVVGGIVGSQLGAGRGNTAATVIGAAGGAYAGHELEKRNQQQSDAYKFTIRMRDGSYQTVTQTTNPDIRVGDRVQVDNGVARRY